MKPEATIESLIAYHRGMGRDLAEFVVTAAAGEDIAPADLTDLTEISRIFMISDIRDNLQSYGAAPNLIKLFCAAASEAMTEHLTKLAPGSLEGHA